MNLEGVLSVFMVHVLRAVWGTFANKNPSKPLLNLGSRIYNRF